MPTTLIEGPNSISAFGTLDSVANQTMDVNGDGRLLESNTHLDFNTTISLTSAGGNNSYGSAFKNCFNDNQIPLDAIITGVEIVSDTTLYDPPNVGPAEYSSFFGTSNTNPSTGRILMRCRLFNGEEYSDLLEWNTDSDITFFSPDLYGNVLALFEGPSKYYGASGDNQVLFGGSTDLSGLNWNPDNQADFGYALTVQLSNSTEADFIIRRGIGLRVTYEQPFLSSKIIINSGTKVKLAPSTPVVPAGTTNLELPNEFANIGNEIGDGTNYGALASQQATRFLDQSPYPELAVTATSPTGVRYYDFFDSTQIPLDSVIMGIEVIAGPDYDDSPDHSRIGTAAIGGNDNATMDVEVRLHNGVAYSSPLTYNFTNNTYLNTSGEIGLTFSNSNTKATFIGRSVNYPNQNPDNDIIFGSTLAGLNWDPNNQANFGLAFTFTNEVNNITLFYSRGIGLKVSYGYPVTNHSKITLKQN